MKTDLEILKTSKRTLKIGGKEREIKFCISAWAELEEKYGSIQNIEKLGEEMESKPMTYLIDLAWIGLQDKEVYNEDGKRTGKQLDKRTLLDEYTMADIEKVTACVLGALYGSLPTSDESNDVESDDKERV